MAKKNSVPRRISFELDDIIQEIKKMNDLNTIQASKEAAKIIKEMKIKKFKIRREEIKF